MEDNKEDQNKIDTQKDIECNKNLDNVTNSEIQSSQQDNNNNSNEITNTNTNLNVNINSNEETSINNNANKLEKEEQTVKVLNSEYYNEFNQPKYNDIVDYENMLREEIENTTPLLSEQKDLDTLLNEYENSIFSVSIKEVKNKYKSIRYVRRDGNCFYRSFLFRLFEYCTLPDNKSLFDSLIEKLSKCKDILEFNGYEWSIVEDFYDALISELKLVKTLDNDQRQLYIELLFSSKEKVNYMIAFVRIFISAYIKENRFLYENFIIDEDLDSWCRREVEPIDIEADNLQIIAVTNCFNVGVIIESLTEKKIETIKLPEEGCLNYFIHLFFRPGHYDILYS